jgi:type IV fimbrial biogenesis protein FimT
MNKGFTLVELMIVVAILAVLVTVAAPSFRASMANTKVNSATHELLSSLSLAKSESIKRNVMVSLCPSSDQLSCSGDGNWQLGWIIFVDNNNNGIRENSETIIQIQNAFDTSLTLTGPNVITYNVGGYLEPAVAISLQGSAIDATNNKWVCVSAIGHGKVADTSC